MQEEAPVTTASGLLLRPLGRLRLSVIHLVVALMGFDDAAIVSTIVENRTIEACLVRALVLQCVLPALRLLRA